MDLMTIKTEKSAGALRVSTNLFEIGDVPCYKARSIFQKF